MIYLIGGAPRAGKTILAQRLSSKLILVANPKRVSNMHVKGAFLL